MTAELPPLPPLNDKLHLLMRGPTLACNWVIPGILMAGGYPGSFDDRENELLLKSVLNKGIDTFVCLQLELDDEVPEAAWRAGQALRPYFPDARRLSKKPLIWRHLPIMDGCACEEDEVMEALVCDLLDDIQAGRVLYVHCLGGHGRTGIVVSLLLAVLYGLPVTDAFKRVQAYHDCRIEPQGVKSPQTVAQRFQVKRLLQKWASNQKQQADDMQANDPEPNGASEADSPQMVVAKNGARGFIVPDTSQPPKAAPQARPAKEERRPATPTQTAPTPARAGANQLRGHPKQQGTLMAQNRLQAKAANSQSSPSLQLSLSNEAKRREISMHRAPSTGSLASRLGGSKAAGTGVAAVQMLRKSSAKLAMP